MTMNDETPVRRAVITNISKETAARYLPANYHVVCTVDGGKSVLIEGHDDAGWTMDDYVIPRLASGLFHCREIHKVGPVDLDIAPADPGPDWVWPDEH